ncbi:AWPM-19-like family protein [Striga hermonthica]|uniref:AWPM-19-like family protein n=1 Tax=Striga hermonthica TaxID=68872 RepID=A0A9N7NPF5_STRHE|nr:AWPM-19-like family protein [Striga hermonthica]
MASGAGKSTALVFLTANVILYFIIIVFSSWAVNHGIEQSRYTVIFSLLAGVVGFTTSITGIYNVKQWNAPNLHAAASSSLVAWLLTLLAMGVACNEISIGWIESNLRILEIALIFVSVSHLFSTVAIHIGVADVVASTTPMII